MTQKTHLARLAASAALALAAGPVLAQDSPAIVVPDVAPPAAPPEAPVVTLPPVSPPAPEPPVMAEEAPPAAAEPVSAAPAEVRAAPVSEAAARPAAGPATPVESVAEAEIAPAALPPAEANPPVEANDPAPAATAEAAPADDPLAGMLPFILAAVLILALAFWGLIAIGRRRPPAQRVAVRDEARTQREPAAAPADVSRGGQAAPVSAVPLAPAAPEPAPAPVAHSGAAVALPREAPTTYEERTVLLRRMIAARPDRANPFVSPKARARRAKLILQSLGHRFDRRPLIDLSQYPQNWPELAKGEDTRAA